MKVTALFLILCFVEACGQSSNKTTESKKHVTRNLQHDFDILIPEGQITVDVMDEVKMSPRRQELMTKFMQAVQANREWFMQQERIVDSTGEPMKYDPRVGMTEQEFNEYMNMMKTMSDMEVASSGQESVKVSKSKGIIEFKSEGKLSYLNSTTIDTRNNIVKVFGYVLTPVDTICVTDTDNVFKSAWRGYKWEYSDPKNVTMPTTKEELANFTMTLYSFILGTFDKTGKTYIEIAGSETYQGKKTVNYKIPIVF